MQPTQPEKGMCQDETAGPDESPFWEVVFRYTRTQAIEDGVLVDVTETARECGFTIPVALSARAWTLCVSVPPDAAWQDETGRLWDVLNVLRFSAQARRGEACNRVDFKLHIVQAERRSELVELYALCGPGDQGEPVITIMLPDED